MNSEFVDVERVALGEEGGWNDAAEEKTAVLKKHRRDTSA